MNNFRSQEAVHNVDSLRELIDPTLGILERHRTNSYSPQVFTFEIPIALQDIDRYLSRVKDCIEHRPAPLQQGFSIEEANTVVKLAEGCKHSLHRVQNDIPNLNDPAHHRRLVDEGYDILSHLRGQAQKLVTFYNNLERWVRAVFATLLLYAFAVLLTMLQDRSRSSDLSSKASATGTA